MEKNYTYKSPDKLANIVIILVLVCLLFSAASIAGSFVENTVYEKYPDEAVITDINTEDNAVIGDIALFIHLPKTLVFLTAIAVFMMWIYRIHENGRALELDGTIYAPGWSVAFYFIPIVNFVLPLLSLLHLYKSCWKRWKEKNSIAAKDSSKIWLLYAWWLLFWSSYLVSNPASLAAGEQTIAMLRSEVQSFIVSEIIYIAAGILFIFILRKVTAVQKNMK
ncbi:DUF4328 domain-containing protein [Alteribacillus sp. HJP-4]|uniref:DUF4328 domain-containing protein n=1 Tax=Alteribacillus sp. HJP-4 TaxID=2775394 RepID=UPI0035CCCCD5